MKSKLKEILSPYNIAVAICIIVIIVSLYIVFKPEIKTKNKQFVNGVEIVQTKKDETEEISEKEARQIAVKQFKKLGEKVKEDSLSVTKIQRKGEECYYIVSQSNNLEIRVRGGKITRINSAVVEEVQ